MKPFLKWAGSKQSISETILEHLPDGERLVEPFAGSGAIFLATDYDAYLLNDVNEDLYRVFTVLKARGPEFIETCRDLFTPEMNTEERYYEIRDEFNELMADLGELSEAERKRRAALFVYLNRHGFNGLCRYNQQGGFNVSFGHYKKTPVFPGERMRGFWHKARAAEFTCLDFEEAMDRVEPGDVVYCDPPYIPLSSTSSFTNYAKGGFGPTDQQRLARKAETLAARGVPVVISNHDVSVARELYSRADYIHDFPVQRYISAKGEGRKQARELVAVFGAESDPAGASRSLEPLGSEGAQPDPDARAA